MLFDELVHAARIGVHDFGGVRFEEGGFAVRGAGEAVRAELFVDEQRCGAEDFRKLPASGAAEQIHLPETVLRHYVALGLREIFH